MRDVKWRPAVGFPAYEVSEFGALRRVLKSRTRKAGTVLIGARIKGYIVYKLATPQGPRMVRANRLVAEAFIGSPPTAKHEAAHWDGVRSNNHDTNLHWATRAENEADTRRHGSKRGERNSQARLTRQIVTEIRQKHEAGLSYLTLAKLFGVAKSTVSGIVTRRSWV